MADFALVMYRFAWGHSCEYVFEDVGDVVWVAGVWCAGMFFAAVPTKKEKEETSNADFFHSVYGFAWIQHYTHDKATAIREGNRFEVSSRR